MDEDKEELKEEDYLDLTTNFVKEPIPEPIIPPQQPPQESPKEPTITSPIKSIPSSEVKNKKKGHLGIILGVLFILVLASLGLNAYMIKDTNYLKSQLDNPEVIYSGDWDCFTEKCSGYMTLNEWSKDNCNSDLTECDINYQGQELTLPFGQINLPPDHELLCKKYICSTEIPIRRYSE